MEKSEILRRLEKIASHAVHVVGEKPFVMSMDDGIAVYDAIALLKEEKEPVLSHEDTDGVPHCGSCGWVQSWGCNYCDNCGKPLRWE